MDQVYLNMSSGQEVAAAETVFDAGARSSAAAESAAATAGDEAEQEMPSSCTTRSSFGARPKHENSFRNFRRFRILPMALSAGPVAIADYCTAGNSRRQR